MNRFLDENGQESEKDKAARDLMFEWINCLSEEYEAHLKRRFPGASKTDLAWEACKDYLLVKEMFNTWSPHFAKFVRLLTEQQQASGERPPERPIRKFL